MNNEFGSIWGKMSTPIIATIGAIDDETNNTGCNIMRIGLSAIQMDNIPHETTCNEILVSFNKKTTIAHIYNAWGINKMERNRIRISKTLANELNCSIGDSIEIMPTITTHDNTTNYTIDAKVAITIYMTKERTDGTTATETIKRNIEIDDVDNIQEVQSYANTFIEAVERGLQERLKH